MKTEAEIKRDFENTFIKINSKDEKDKAYLISDKNCDAEGQIIVWAKGSGIAKSIALGADCFDGFDFIELTVIRQKCFDKYLNTQRIPIRELLKQGWGFECANCRSQLRIYEDDIEAGEAFIKDENSEYYGFAKGAVICDKCKKEMEND